MLELLMALPRVKISKSSFTEYYIKLCLLMSFLDLIIIPTD